MAMRENPPGLEGPARTTPTPHVVGLLSHPSDEQYRYNLFAPAAWRIVSMHHRNQFAGRSERSATSECRACRSWS